MLQIYAASRGGSYGGRHDNLLATKPSPSGWAVCVSAEFSEKNSRYDPTRRSRARADSSLSRRRLACCLSSSVNQSINRRRRRRDRSAARNLHVSTPVVPLSPSPSPDICPPRTSAPPFLPPRKTTIADICLLVRVLISGYGSRGVTDVYF